VTCDHPNQILFLSKTKIGWDKRKIFVIFGVPQVQKMVETRNFPLKNSSLSSVTWDMRDISSVLGAL
jgi:hypothetical protein